MKTLRLIASTIGAAVMVASALGQATIQDAGTLPGFPSVVTNQSTNVVSGGAYLDLAGARSLVVYVGGRAKTNTSAAGTNKFFWSGSADAAFWTTRDTNLEVDLAYNSTNAVVIPKRLDVSLYKYIRFDRAECTDTNLMTNAAASYLNGH